MRKFVAIVFVAVIALSSDLMTGCGSAPTPTVRPTPTLDPIPTPAPAPPDPKARALEIVHGARAAMTDIESYHMAMETNPGGNTIEGDWLASGVAQMNITEAGAEMQSILVDGKYYLKCTKDKRWELFDSPPGVLPATGQAPQEMMQTMEKLVSDLGGELAGSDMAGGVSSYRVKFTASADQLGSLLGRVASSVSLGAPTSPGGAGGQGLSLASLGPALKQARATGEIWIGKEDQYLHKVALDVDLTTVVSALPTPGPDDPTGLSSLTSIHQEITYSDYNEPIDIKAPTADLIWPTPEAVTGVLSAGPTEVPAHRYPVDERYVYENTLVLQIPSVDVLADGKLRVNYVVTNISASRQDLYCPTAEERAASGPTEYLLLADGSKIPFLDDNCAPTPGRLVRLQPGAAWEEYEIFPPLSDPSKPFRVVWETWGLESPEISLSGGS